MVVTGVCSFQAALSVSPTPGTVAVLPCLTGGNEEESGPAHAAGPSGKDHGLRPRLLDHWSSESLACSLGFSVLTSRSRPTLHPRYGLVEVVVALVPRQKGQAAGSMEPDPGPTGGVRPMLEVIACLRPQFRQRLDQLVEYAYIPCLIPPDGEETADLRLPPMDVSVKTEPLTGMAGICHPDAERRALARRWQCHDD